MWHVLYHSATTAAFWSSVFINLPYRPMTIHGWALIFIIIWFNVCLQNVQVRWSQGVQEAGNLSIPSASTIHQSSNAKDIKYKTWKIKQVISSKKLTDHAMKWNHPPKGWPGLLTEKEPKLIQKGPGSSKKSPNGAKLPNLVLLPPKAVIRVC